MPSRIFRTATAILSLVSLFYAGCSRDAGTPEQEGILRELIEVAGVSTHEDRVLEKIQERIPKSVPQHVDERNNLLVTLGSGKPEIIFIAHMDEVGLEVAGINMDGTLNVSRRGGFFPTIWESRVVKLYTKTGIIDGIVPPRESYRDDNPDTYASEHIVVYVGTDSRDETLALGIQPGDYIVQPKRMTRLAGHRFTAGSIDDRAGCAALILALHRVAGQKLNNTVTFAWCVEEETGLDGSGFIAQSMSPDYAFAVDTFVSSDAPRDASYIGCAPLGAGAVLRLIDSSIFAPRDTFIKVRNIARRRNIPVQWSITSGSTDGTRFLPVGSLVLPLSWPGIYSHTFISIIDMRDFTALVDLIVAIAESNELE